MPTAIELPSSDEPSNKEDAMAERARIIEERNALQLKVSVLLFIVPLFDPPFSLRDDKKSLTFLMAYTDNISKSTGSQNEICHRPTNRPA